MKGFLKGWNLKETGTGPACFSDDDLTPLKAANGAEFDRLFLQGMIGHRRGALTAAEMEQTEGQSLEARSLVGTTIAIAAGRDQRDGTAPDRRRVGLASCAFEGERRVMPAAVGEITELVPPVAFTFMRAFTTIVQGRGRSHWPESLWSVIGDPLSARRRRALVGSGATE